MPIEYYSGVEDGEILDRGRPDAGRDAVVAAGREVHAAGRGTWQNWQQPMPVPVKVEQNVNRGVNFCCAFILLLIVPLLGIFQKVLVRVGRWKDSMFSVVGRQRLGRVGRLETIRRLKDRCYVKAII